jgi:hypothetical protein
MSGGVDWRRVAGLLDELYSASAGLEALFPGRKFTLDGHLVGSVGEVVAAYMFDLDLNPASTLGHDARSRDGREVEIKLTQGDAVALRHEPEHLLVLQRQAGGPVRVVYNGPGAPVWQQAGRRQSNGQRRIGLAKLVALSRLISPAEQLKPIRNPPV